MTTAPGFSMAVLGTVAVICQALLLRESMTTLGGSEIAWGLVLFLWLAGAGLGARLGAAVVSGGGGARWSPLAVALGSTGGVALLRAAPWLLVDVGGEVASGPTAFILWIAAIVPPAMAVGFGFARIAEALGSACSSYAIESLGAAVGGCLFTFGLAPIGSPAIAGAAIGIGVLACLWTRSRVMAAAALAVFCAAGFAAGPWTEKATWAAGRRRQPLARALETRHQRVEVGAGPDSPVYIDGRFSGIYPVDPYIVVPKSRLIILLHTSPEDIAVIGGLTDGRVVGLLDPPVKRLHIIEEDPLLIEALRSEESGQVDALLSDPRVEVEISEPLRALRTVEGLDIIILFDGPPLTLRTNRTRTREFFELCRSSLATDGVLVVDGGARDDYLGGAAGRLLAMQLTTLSAVFPQVKAIAGDPVTFVAANGEGILDLTAPTIEQRWESRTEDPGESLGILLPTLLQPVRSAALTSDLMAYRHVSANTIDRPQLILPAAALSEALAFRPLLRGLAFFTDELRWVAAIPLLMALMWIVLTPRVGSPTRIRTAPAVVLGFASMTWWLLLMAAWQGARGSVYSEVGLLTALFMAGLAGGAAIMRRPPRALTLPRLFASGAALSVAIALVAGRQWPIALTPVLLILGGMITGAAFPGVAAIAGGHSRKEGIARGFAGDEFGAGAAALVVGVIGLPWLGMGAIATSTAMLCLAVVTATFRPTITSH